jgi:iron complex outermembrane recepter protein
MTRDSSARPSALTGTLRRHVRSRALLAAAAALTIAHTGAAAQTMPDTARFRLDSLAVPVTRGAVAPARAPLALSVVGRSGIQDARPTLTLQEALSSVPGLLVSDRQNFSLGPRIIMRGMGARAAFGVRGVRVLVDGIPLTMPDGQTNLNNLDLGSAGTIHVLRGPASALFGNAAGGVIAVETEPAPGPLATEARLLLGDQARGDLSRAWKAQAKVAGTFWRGDYLASAARLDAGGYRDHARSRQNSFNGRVSLDASRATRVDLLLNVLDMPLAQNPGSLPLDSAVREPTMAWPNNVRTGSGEQTRQAQLGARLRYDRAQRHADITAYVIRRSLLNPLPFGVIDLGRTAGGVRAVYEHRFSGVRTAPTLTTGVDLEAQRDDRREFANDGGTATGPARRDQDDSVTGIGPFVQLRAEVGGLGLTAGARYDAVRFAVRDRRGVEPDRSGGRTLRALSPMIGATYAIGPATVFANVASAFQTPTTTELINAPPAPGQPCCPAGFNPELEPQRARSLETGVRADLGPRLYGTATAYTMAVRDMLIPFQVPTVEGRDFFRNAGRTRHRGVELSAGARAHATVLLEAAYTLMDVRFVAGAAPAHEGNRVPGVPAQRIHIAGTWSPGRSVVSAEFDHTGRQYADDANDTVLPGATRLDLRAQTELDAGAVQLAPFIAVHNTLNRSYYGSVSVNAVGSRFYEPAPARSVFLGASIRTGGWRR